MARKTRTSSPDKGIFLPTATQQDKSQYQAILKELDRRKKEALRVYKPLPYQERYHACRARRVIIRKGNRVGGSLAGYVEVARALLGKDPHNKYPKKGTCVCLGWGENHIGTVIHRMLFRPGAFYMRKDESGDWVPCCNDDAGAEPAPPLIPEQFCEDWSWEKKAEFIFSRVVVKTEETEWELLACNSKGDPNMLQGLNVHLYDIDEDIDKQGWFVEAMMRTTAVNGFIRWHAMPQARNDAMLHLLDECEDQSDAENPTAVCITAAMVDNKYTSDKSKREDIKALTQYFGEDVAKQRASGELNRSARQVYPTFDKYRHSAVVDEPTSAMQAKLKELNGTIPHEWCRYATFDPGHNVFAILFWAVPPEDLGDYRIVYRELCVREANAEKFADEFQLASRGECFQDFIIDDHGARLTSLDTGNRPRKQYERALKARNITCIESGASFTPACDDIPFRENATREWLRTREDGTTKLLIVTENCPTLVKEMARFRKKTRDVGGEVLILDEADRSRPGHDTVDALEYGAAHGLKYVAPPKRQSNKTWLESILQGRREREQRRRRRLGSPSIILGARGA